MFNYRQSNVIEKNTFVDEFEVQSQNNVATEEVSSEERAFNARIKDNFDRIINYDAYNRQSAVYEREQAINSFMTAGSSELAPSATTMQYQCMPKAEIYQDFRAETGYYTQTKIRPGAKVAVFMLTLVVALLSVLVVFNTTLLNNMNGLIASKSGEVAKLQAEYQTVSEELMDVSSDQSIIDKATEIGMKG